MTTTPDDDPLPIDPRVEEILDVFAREARIERHRLLPETRADELGIGSLDLALALFALEDRFGIALPELPLHGDAVPTVGDVVRRVIKCIDAPKPVAAAAPAG